MPADSASLASPGARSTRRAQHEDRSPLRISPTRPKGPVTPVVGHSHSQSPVEWRAQPPPRSATSSLFGYFMSKPEVSSASTVASNRAPSMADSLYGGLEDMAEPSRLVSPQDAREFARKSDNVVRTAEVYRQKIQELSAAAAEFGDALDACSRTKGARAGSGSTAGDLQTAGGLHLLVSNHFNLLARSVETKLSQPLSREVREYNSRVSSRENQFKVTLRQKIRALRSTESARSSSTRQKLRNLVQYRSTLLDLTSQVDDINRCKFEFLGDLHNEAEDLGSHIRRSLASTVTAEIEIFDGIARKGWSGGGLDNLLGGCPDPFEGEPASVDEDPPHEPTPSPETPTPERDVDNNLFSVLPRSRSILPAGGQPDLSDLTLEHDDGPASEGNVNQSEENKNDHPGDEQKEPEEDTEVVPSSPSPSPSPRRETENGWPSG